LYDVKGVALFFLNCVVEMFSSLVLEIGALAFQAVEWGHFGFPRRGWRDKQVIIIVPVVASQQHHVQFGGVEGDVHYIELHFTVCGVFDHYVGRVVSPGGM
jgi:hypothetical protein